MKKVALIQIYPWDKGYLFGLPDFDIKTGDRVIVKSDLGVEVGKVIQLKEVEDKELPEESTKSIIRKANLGDLERVKEKDSQKEKALQICKDLVMKHKMPIKLVDCSFSFDGGRITFAFTAEGRVDFRELVKDLTRHFQKSIRLQQIGSRDETRKKGGIGTCGRTICCYEFLRSLGNVTTDLVKLQQLEHRGSERLSGVCGRLKCCLSYEQDLYNDLIKDLPPINSEVRTDKGKGKVISWNVLRRSVNVLIDDEGIVIEKKLDKS